MTTYKFDSEMAGTMKYDAQQLVYLADRAIFANSEWDKEYWYNEAVKVLDKMAFHLSSYQQDVLYREPVLIDDEIPF